MKSSRLFKVIFLLSLVFLGVYLYRADILDFLPVLSYGRLALSLLFLFCGFILQAGNWHQILKSQFPIRFSDALVSDGLTIFSKYVPGKVMVVLGKAAYIQGKYGYKQAPLILKSFDSQMLTLWLGTIFGLLSFVWLEGKSSWGVYAFLLVIVLSVLLFTPLFHRAIVFLARITMKKRLTLSHLGVAEIWRVLPVHASFWIFLTLGFYFFVSAFSPISIPLYVGFVFPLSAVMGIVAIFAPGGIGIREGVLAALLHLSGMDLAFATSLAVISRMWFLLGEGMYFFTAVVCHFTARRSVS